MQQLQTVLQFCCPQDQLYNCAKACRTTHASLPQASADTTCTLSSLLFLPLPLPAAVNFSYGTKYTLGAPCENYYTLRSRGGPDSSLVGEYERKTTVKVGCPQPEPIFRYSYDPKRSDIGAKDGAKDGGKDAKKAGPKRMLSSGKLLR